jgi:hypothetical protein
VAASNAAASAASWLSPLAGRPGRPAEQAAPHSVARAAPRDTVELLWFDRAAVGRIRGAKALRDVFDEQPAERRWLKKDEGPREPDEARDRRDVQRALARGRALEGSALDTALAEGFDDDGAFSPPIVAVSGELALCFDDEETLSATLAVVGPLVGADKRLREVVDAAASIGKGAWKTPSDVIEGALARIRDAFTQGNRAVGPAYLQASVERLLLEGRKYEQRMILGQQRIRGLLSPPGVRAPIPTYLPASLSEELPLFRRFPAKIIAELRYQQDEGDPHPNAFIALVLGRALPRAGRQGST